MKKDIISLETFLTLCQEKGIEPYQAYNGELIAKISPSLHEKIRIAAASAWQSFNEWVASALKREVVHA